MTGADGQVDVENFLGKPREYDDLLAVSQAYAWGRKNELPADLRSVSTAAWARSVEFANRNIPPWQLHHVHRLRMEFDAGRRKPAPQRDLQRRPRAAPFSSVDSRRPEDLVGSSRTRARTASRRWRSRTTATPATGLMYDWNDSDGSRSTRNTRERRILNEPVSEISQNKGQSETLPALSPNDEFADFEVFDYMEGDRRHAGRPAGSYLRDALSRGLVLQREVGVNPFKYGFVGASDLHSGLSVSAQADYAGSYYRPNIAAGRPSKAEAASILTEGSRRVEQNRPTTAGSLTGVWAESNTRESIYDALRRRETFATTGTRLKLRFFGGWELTDALLNDENWLQAAYAARRTDGQGSCRASSRRRRSGIRHLGHQGSKWRQPRPAPGNQGMGGRRRAEGARVRRRLGRRSKARSEDGHATPSSATPLTVSRASTRTPSARLS